MASCLVHLILMGYQMNDHLAVKTTAMSTSAMLAGLLIAGDLEL